MLVMYILLALIVGFVLGAFTMSMFVANVVRQNGGRYTYTLPHHDEATEEPALRVSQARLQSK